MVYGTETGTLSPSISHLYRLQFTLIEMGFTYMWGRVPLASITLTMLGNRKYLSPSIHVSISKDSDCLCLINNHCCIRDDQDWVITEQD